MPSVTIRATGSLLNIKLVSGLRAICTIARGVNQDEVDSVKTEIKPTPAALRGDLEDFKWSTH